MTDTISQQAFKIVNLDFNIYIRDETVKTFKSYPYPINISLSIKLSITHQSQNKSHILNSIIYLRQIKVYNKRYQSHIK